MGEGWTGLRFQRPSPAMVVALVALFCSLCGVGWAVSKAPKNSVVSESIKNGQVKTRDIAKSAVASSKIRNGGIRQADLAPDSVGPLNVLDDSLGGPDIDESTLGLVPEASDAALFGGRSLTQVRSIASADTEPFSALVNLSDEMPHDVLETEVEVPEGGGAILANAVVKIIGFDAIVECRLYRDAGTPVAISQFSTENFGASEVEMLPLVGGAESLPQGVSDVIVRCNATKIVSSGGAGFRGGDLTVLVVPSG